MMMNICFGLMILALVACEPARLRRDNEVSSQNPLSSDESDTMFISQGNSIDEGAGFSHCSNAPMASAMFIGAVQACKNKYDANHIKLKINNDDGGKRTCVITTYTDNSGNVIPLRSRQSCFAHQADEVKVAKLVSDHPTFPHTAPNSLIIIKEEKAAGFYECINAADNYIANPNNCCSGIVGINIAASCQGTGKPRNQCYSEAYAHRDNICLSFKNNYKNKYYLTYPI